MKNKFALAVTLIVVAVLLAVFFVWCIYAINHVDNEDNEATGAVLGWVIFLATGIHLSWPLAAACMITLGILLLATKKVVSAKRTCLALWIICLVLAPFCAISAVATFALSEFFALFAPLQTAVCVLYLACTVWSIVTWAKLRKVKTPYFEQQVPQTEDSSSENTLG